VPQPSKPTPTIAPRTPCALAARFAELRRARGSALAVLDVDEHQALTRDDLARAADRVGEVLDAVIPVGERAVVAVQLANGAEFFASILACWERDLVPVPVDHDVSPESVIDLCHAVCASVLLRADAAGRVVAVPWRDSLEAPAALAPAIALLKVTSGTTGEPRAVALATEALEAGVAQIVSTMGLEPVDRNLVTIPLAHSYAFDNVVLTLLRDGMPAILARDLTPKRLLTVAREGAATVLPTVPFLVDVLGRSTMAGTVPSLRCVISAGAPLPVIARERFARAFGVRPRTFYGATECGGIAFDREGDGDLPEGCVGVALERVRIALADPDEDGIGRVRVHSASVATAYHPAPARADARDEVELERGSFFTADLGGFDARGRLQLVGRVREVVNVGGRKVHPAEIERVIREVPGVIDVVVSGVARSSVADALRALVAAEPDVTRADIAAACEQRLARYKVPRSIEIVRELPRTGRGKLDRRAVDARYPIG
jgi:acyl-CoA synthetase (AMP-forming)/AMP-acid ligase II